MIRETVSASVTAAMAGAANIMRAAAEARLATEETGGRLLELIKSHLRHICSVVIDEKVPSIWAEVVTARTVATKLALLTQFL